MMGAAYRTWLQRILIFCCSFLLYFECSGPREVFDAVFNTSPRNPQYLFASSSEELCRRVRRVTAHGKVNIYVENLSTHGTHVVFTQRQVRALLSACYKAIGE